MSNQKSLNLSHSERIVLLAWIHIILFKYEKDVLYDEMLQSLIPKLVSAKIKIEECWKNYDDDYSVLLNYEEILSIMYVSNIKNFDPDEDDISLETMQFLITIHMKAKFSFTG